jgi:hypothetical protein
MVSARLSSDDNLEAPFALQAAMPRERYSIRPSPQTRKKRAAGSPAALKVDNREASNRVDRSHSVSKRGQFQS